MHERYGSPYGQQCPGLCSGMLESVAESAPEQSMVGFGRGLGPLNRQVCELASAQELAFVTTESRALLPNCDGTRDWFAKANRLYEPVPAIRLPGEWEARRAGAP